jgi:hypothetical protein
MSGLGGGHFVGRSQLLQGVRPHRVQEPVSGAMLPCGNHCDQRLIHKPGQHLKRHAGGHRAGGVGIESADKHRPGSRQLNAERKMINPGTDLEDGGF